MEAIGIYVALKNKTKSEIEKEMKFIAERNAEIERILREAEEVKKELKSNRKRMMELAIAYTNMKEEM